MPYSREPGRLVVIGYDKNEQRWRQVAARYNETKAALWERGKREARAFHIPLTRLRMVTDARYQELLEAKRTKAHQEVLAIKAKYKASNAATRKPAKQPDKSLFHERSEKLRMKMIAAHKEAHPEKSKQAEDAYFKAARAEQYANMRLSIRKHTYNGVDGYLLYGGGRGIYGTRIFTRTREEAEHMREQMRRGKEPTFDKRRTSHKH